MVLNDAHDGVIGGHFIGKTTLQKILLAGLWFSTMHVDAQEYYHNCDLCRRIRNLSLQYGMPLVP